METVTRYNKKEVIDEVARKTGFTKKNSGIFLDAFLDTIVEFMCDDITVNFTNFGKFEPVMIKERDGVNPQNPKEKIHIPAYKTPKFKPSAYLKDLIKCKL